MLIIPLLPPWNKHLQNRHITPQSSPLRQSSPQCIPSVVPEQFWLVVWTPLKNISQLGWLFPIYGKIQKCSKPPTRVALMVTGISLKWLARWNSHYFYRISNCDIAGNLNPWVSHHFSINTTILVDSPCSNTSNYTSLWIFFRDLWKSQFKKSVASSKLTVCYWKWP